MAAVHAVLCAARAAGRGDERLAGGGRRRGGDYGGDGGDGGARERLRRADFGALGCVLFEMLSGFGPWDALPSLVGTPRRGGEQQAGLTARRRGGGGGGGGEGQGGGAREAVAGASWRGSGSCSPRCRVTRGECTGGTR